MLTTLVVALPRTISLIPVSIWWMKFLNLFFCVIWIQGLFIDPKSNQSEKSEKQKKNSEGLLMKLTGKRRWDIFCGSADMTPQWNGNKSFFFPFLGCMIATESAHNITHTHTDAKPGRLFHIQMTSWDKTATAPPVFHDLRGYRREQKRKSHPQLFIISLPKV